MMLVLRFYFELFVSKHLMFIISPIHTFVNIPVLLLKNTTFPNQGRDIHKSVNGGYWIDCWWTPGGPLADEPLHGPLASSDHDGNLSGWQLIDAFGNHKNWHPAKQRCRDWEKKERVRRKRLKIKRTKNMRRFKKWDIFCNIYPLITFWLECVAIENLLSRRWESQKNPLFKKCV